MEIKEINNIYFSPTYSTEKVVKIVGNVLSDKSTNIDLTVRQRDYSNYEFNQDEICVVGVPSFGGRVPRDASERLKKIKGNNTLAVIVVTYGNRAYEDTLLELKNILKDSGFICIAAIGVVCEHSIVSSYAKGRPDDSDIKTLENYALQIRSVIENDLIREVRVPGNIPYKKYGTVPIVPDVNESCTSCGYCAKVCPVGAIPMDNPNSTDNKKCISCMRCIKVCSSNARYLDEKLIISLKHKLKEVCSVRKETELFL